MGAYLPTGRHAKPFYCSAFSLNIKSSQMYLTIPNWATNVWGFNICLSIQNMPKDC